MRLLILTLLVLCTTVAIVESIEFTYYKRGKWWACGAEEGNESFAFNVVWYLCRTGTLKINRCCKTHDACYKRKGGKWTCDNQLFTCMIAAGGVDGTCAVLAGAFRTIVFFAGQSSYDS